jgi:hypothetical protein
VRIEWAAAGLTAAMPKIESTAATVHHERDRLAGRV